MEAIIFIGLQGSGKSTFYKHRFAETHRRINLDELKTRHQEKWVLLATIGQKLSFVVDNTNATKEQRSKFIVPAKEAGYRIICYYFIPDAKRSLEQNALRTGKAKVHPAAIYGTRKKMEQPEWAEGFDAIYQVEFNTAGEPIVTQLPGP